jgi:hypothetical protein
MGGGTDTWTLLGFDTFSYEWYGLDGSFGTRQEAEAAARERLRGLDKTQPVASSGGQYGIQDQVYVVSPSGNRYRIMK